MIPYDRNRHTQVAGHTFYVCHAPGALRPGQKRDHDKDFVRAQGPYATKDEAWRAVTGPYTDRKVGRWTFTGQGFYWAFRVYAHAHVKPATVERLEKYVVIEVDAQGRKVTEREEPRRSNRLLAGGLPSGGAREAQAVQAAGQSVSYRPPRATRRPDLLTFMEAQAQRGFPMTVTINAADAA